MGHVCRTDSLTTLFRLVVECLNCVVCCFGSLLVVQVSMKIMLFIQGGMSSLNKNFGAMVAW